MVSKLMLLINAHKFVEMALGYIVNVMMGILLTEMDAVRNVKYSLVRSVTLLLEEKVYVAIKIIIVLESAVHLFQETW